MCDDRWQTEALASETICRSESGNPPTKITGLLKIRANAMDSTLAEESAARENHAPDLRPMGIIMALVAQEGVRLVELTHVADVFVSGLAEVEDIGGGCFRFTFYSRQQVGGHEERVAVARLVAPADAVPPAILLAANALGLSLVTRESFLPGTTH